MASGRFAIVKGSFEFRDMELKNSWYLEFVILSTNA